MYFVYFWTFITRYYSIVTLLSTSLFLRARWFVWYLRTSTSELYTIAPRVELYSLYDRFSIEESASRLAHSLARSRAHWLVLFFVFSFFSFLSDIYVYLYFFFVFCVLPLFVIAANPAVLRTQPRNVAGEGHQERVLWQLREDAARHDHGPHRLLRPPGKRKPSYYRS